MKQSFILTLSNSENTRHPPIALARYRMLLMFFTSVLMPSGSPGLWTDTFASTLNCPSEGETEISMGMKYGSSVPECVGQTGRKKERKKKKWLPYQTCCLDRFPGPAGWAGALWQLQQPLLHSSCLAPSPTPSDLHLMDVKTAVVHDSFCFDLNNKAECEKL